MSRRYTLMKDSHCDGNNVSVPDLSKLKKEWDEYQQSDTGHPIPDTQMQIDLLNIRMDTEIRKPQIRLKMGASQYFSKRSKSPTGDWNEGFLFVVSYHAQLFNTIEFDLYDKPHKRWPTTRHIGKAKLKISSLENKDQVTVTFLPIYEYHSKRLLPSDLKDSLMEMDWIDPTTISKKIQDLNLIGSVQIRIRYKFQYPVHESLTATHRLVSEDTLSHYTASSSDSSSTHSARTNHLLDVEDIWHPLSTTHSQHSHRSSYGRGDLAQSESVVDDLFKTQLTKIMTAEIPSPTNASTPSSSLLSPRKHHWIKKFVPEKKRMPDSASGRRFGFSQNDSDDREQFNPDQTTDDSSSSLAAVPAVKTKLKRGARKKAQHIIDSVNFGDRNFASQWMQDSFEEVALSHPLVDKLIGLVVSKQTQAMVRAIIKTANSFGQGFRVTGIKLLKSALIIQNYYESLPTCLNTNPITDTTAIDNGCRYFSFALVAYGWRGLCYIGSLAHVTDRTSNRLAIIRFLGIDPQDLLGYEYALRKGASFQPSYYVALDRSRKTIVLSIRGTWSLYDAITDLVCEYKPWKGGLVHSGMLASAQWFYTSIIPQIFRYIHHHHQELSGFIITGHSLGGGTASLLTMMVADHIDELHQLAKNDAFDLHCYNYAPAAVSSPDLGERYRQYITSYVYQDDIVGRLSYGSAMKLKELVLDVISAYEALGGFRAAITDPKIRQVCFNIISQRREKLDAATYPSCLIFQNSALILVMRYTRADVPQDQLYLASTAVVMSEVIKSIACLALLYYSPEPRRRSVKRLGTLLNRELVLNWRESVKLAFPAALYLIQNNLQYVAASNLDAATFQVTYQLKILTTAFFSVVILKRNLSKLKWMALGMLTLGIALVVLPRGAPTAFMNFITGNTTITDTTEASVSGNQSNLHGFLAVLAACLLSGLAGVYFEKILKSAPTSSTHKQVPTTDDEEENKKSDEDELDDELVVSNQIWIRNIQMSFFSVVLGLVFVVMLQDGAKIVERGFFVNYNVLTWTVIGIQAFGGLIVALVVKYADNILKGFATSISIILSSIVSVWLFNFSISLSFLLGATFVIYATYLYGL
ncbi:hypothetical protein MFLAVUS_002836 [Mucor flavus]|uniref:Fungal lipase-type domain-containing protein n=1 Tax=Mucor flavus TaxID=439312 RepID=A0ABP9YRD1_9FUNG